MLRLDSNSLIYFPFNDTNVINKGVIQNAQWVSEPSSTVKIATATPSGDITMTGLNAIYRCDKLLGSGCSKFTIDFWYCYSGSSTHCTRIQNLVRLDEIFQLYVYGTTGSKVALKIPDADTDLATFDHREVRQYRVHIALQYNNGKLQVFIDGVLKGTLNGIKSSATPFVHPLTIGHIRYYTSTVGGQIREYSEKHMYYIISNFHISKGLRWSGNFEPPNEWADPITTPIIYYNTLQGQKLRIITNTEKNGPAIPIYYNGNTYYVPIVGADDSPSEIRIRYGGENLYLQSEQVPQTALQLPTLSFSQKEYRGEFIPPPSYSRYGSIPEVSISGTGLSSQKQVGTYSISYKISDLHKYVWSGITGDTYTISWQITKKNVGVPSLTTQFTYNGSPQGPEISSDLYSLSNNKKTDAGTYTATLSLKDTNTYQWSDTQNSSPRQISYTIDKKVCEGTIILQQDGDAVLQAVKDFNNGQVEISVKQNNADGTSSIVSLDQVTAETRNKISFAVFCNADISVYATYGGDLSADLFTISEATSYHDAGKYRMSFTLKDPKNIIVKTTNYVDQDGNVITMDDNDPLLRLSFTVSKYPIDGAPNIHFTYDGTPKKYSFESGSSYDRALQITRNDAETNADAYAAWFKLKEGWYKNIYWYHTNRDGTIEEYDESSNPGYLWYIDPLTIAIPSQKGTCRAAGNTACTPEFNDWNSQYMSVVSYTASGEDSSRTSSGTYHATIKLTNKNVLWSDGTNKDKTVEWVISGKVVPVPAFEYSTYIKNYKTPTETLFEVAKLDNMDGITITKRQYQANQNLITYTVQLADSNSVWADGYSSSSRNITGTVKYIDSNKNYSIFHVESIEESESPFPTRASGKADPQVARIKTGYQTTETPEIDSRFSYVRITYALRNNDDILKLATLGNKLKWTEEHTDNVTAVSSIESFDSYKKFQITATVSPTPTHTGYGDFIRTIKVTMPTVAVGNLLFVTNSQTLSLNKYPKIDVTGVANVKTKNTTGWTTDVQTVTGGKIFVFGGGDTYSYRYIFDLRNNYNKLTTNHRISLSFSVADSDGYTTEYLDSLQANNAKINLGNASKRAKAMDTYLGDYFKNKISSWSVSTETTKSGSTTTYWTHIDITTEKSMNNSNPGTANPYHCIFIDTSLSVPKQGHTCSVPFVYGDVPDFESETNYNPYFFNSQLCKLLKDYNRGTDTDNQFTPQFFLANWHAKSNRLDYVPSASTRDWYELPPCFAWHIKYGAPTVQKAAMVMRLMFSYHGNKNPVQPEVVDVTKGDIRITSGFSIFNATVKWKEYYSEGKKATSDYYYNKKLIYNNGQSPEGNEVQPDWGNVGFSDFILPRWVKTNPEEDVSSYNKKTICEDYGAVLTFDIAWNGQKLNNEKITTYLYPYKSIPNHNSVTSTGAKGWMGMVLEPY